MKLKLRDPKTGGDLLLFKDEQDFDRLYYSRDHSNKYFTIAWNTGEKQLVTIDGEAHEFLPNTLLTLLFNQSFYFENPTTVVAWQFNREFYCIIDHDAEVSCVGFLFGSTDHLFVKKTQDERFHVIRKFNLLVEANYRTAHSVSFYAQQLCKSPKTLSNLFAIYNHKSPSQVIQERIQIEAKRLLSYTDKSVKEIAYDLGFEDISYFSNFFKKHTGLSPVDFRNNKKVPVKGK